MTGLSLFLLGTVALTNVGLLFYLFGGRKDNMKPPETGTPSSTTEDNVGDDKQPKATVGKSKFRIEDFDERFEMVEKRLEKFAGLMDRLEGNLRLKDVEFANPEDNPTQSEIERDSETVDASDPHKDARMTREQENAAFEDMRIEDVDSDTVSAPSATGASMEDIEESLEVAVNPDATDEQKAKAGKILERLMDTNLMDTIASEAEIQKGVLACIKQSYRIDFADKHSTKIKSITKKKSTIVIADRFEDFNPADLL